MGSPGVPVVTVVRVSPLSTGVLGEGSLSGSDCELVESQPSSLSSKRQAFLTESQENKSMENSSEEVPPISRRKIQEVDRGGAPRPTPGGLVRDTHAKPPKCRSRVGRGGSWKQRHLSQIGEGVRLHTENGVCFCTVHT